MLSFEDKFEDLAMEYTDLILNMLESKATGNPRTYGFEYEFLSETVLDLNHMKELYRFLPHCGFFLHGDSFSHSSGTHISFEPGGQIEYQSIPLFPQDEDTFSATLELIRETNEKILKELDIRYMATGYIPGRKDAQLCLEADRYKVLHSRMPVTGSRGLEMMKATASIHLHVGIGHVSELIPLFTTLCKLSTGDDFGMRAERRDIWNNTDFSRCGSFCNRIYRDSDTRELIADMVRFVLKAQDIFADIPFYMIEKTDFNSFMYHLTTVFTDVRLNIKGPTLELRTLDSVPIPEFKHKWRKFITIMENLHINMKNGV